MKNETFPASLSRLDKSVDDWLKLFNAAGLWISLRRTQVGLSTAAQKTERTKISVSRNGWCLVSGERRYTYGRTSKPHANNTK